MKLGSLLFENTQVPKFVNELKVIYRKYLGDDGFTVSRIENGFKFVSDIRSTYLGKTNAIIPDIDGGISFFKNTILGINREYPFVNVDWNDTSEKGKFVVKITKK